MGRGRLGCLDKALMDICMVRWWIEINSAIKAWFSLVVVSLRYDVILDLNLSCESRFLTIAKRLR
jgi:hypothetical protein